MLREKCNEQNSGPLCNETEVITNTEWDIMLENQDKNNAELRHL